MSQFPGHDYNRIIASIQTVHCLHIYKYSTQKQDELQERLLMSVIQQNLSES